MKKKISKPYRYDLWKFFADNHKLTLLESELNDIVYAVNKQLDIEQKNKGERFRLFFKVGL